MGSRIHTIPLGFDQTYIIKDQGVIMIDGSEPKKRKAVFQHNFDRRSFIKHSFRLSILAFLGFTFERRNNIKT